MKPKLLGGALLLGLSGLLVACGQSDRPRSQPGPAPEVEYSRCWIVTLRNQPVCTLLPDFQLKLWVKAEPDTKVELRAGDQLLKEKGENLTNGRRFLLTIPKGQSLLTARLVQADGKRSAAWSLKLAQPNFPEWYADAQKINPRQLPALLNKERKVAPHQEQGLVLRLLASFAKNQGNEDDAEGYLKKGIETDHGEGNLSDEIEKRVQLARIYLDHGRITEARDLLPLHLPPETPADAEYRVAYNQGLLADRVGDYRLALDELHKAADLAERVGMLSYRWDTEQVLARVLQGLGRSQESSDIFGRLQKDRYPQDPCDLGSLSTNQAWSLLLAREGGEAAGDPTPMLQEALKIFDSDGCLPSQRLNARLNLALAYQQGGHWPEAREVLVKAQPLLPKANLSERLWWLDLEGRIATHENRLPDALARYDELAALAEHAQSLEGRFRAAFGRANVDLKSGKRDAAIEDLGRADRLIDEQIWHIRAYEGRETFVAQQERATRQYLELLLEERNPQAAFTLARRARSRLLRQLTVRDRLAQLTPAEQQRWDQALSKYWALRDLADREAAQDWQHTGDQVKRARESLASKLAEAQKDLDTAMAILGDPGESPLSPPGRGEVILTYHPLSKSQAWVGFAAYPGGLQVTKFTLPDLGDRQALARSLLAPFQRLLDAAERVRVLPYGPLQQVDFHALPLGKELLLDRHLVVYSLDLMAPPSKPAVRHVVLLVGDPEGNLPAAREEAAAIVKAVPSLGPDWTLMPLMDTNANAKKVLAALPSAGLFHFAGHGNFTGLAGWDSELRLADNSRLFLGDLLALHPAPAWVVLSACDASRASERAPGEGIGLAQAFLLAGSQTVIAATQSVQDRSARDLLRDMYQSWQPGEDLSRQFLRAQRACLRQDPASDCVHYRLLER